MIAQIGTTRNDRNNLTKDFTVKNEVNVKWKENTSIITPTLILTTPNIATVTNINYCYVAEMHRYYYINDIILNNDNTVSLQCSVDPLTSFRSEILEINGTVKRAENSSNAYILDSDYKALSYTNIVTKKFPNAMENDSFILMTVG